MPPEPPSADERALVERVQRGDTDAFGELVRRHVPRARALAYRLMRHTDDADDLVQDAFLRALDRIETFDSARPFGPWFLRLLVNTGLDSHRKVRLRQTEPARENVASPRPTPHQDAEAHEIRRRFEAAVATLTPRQRLIVCAVDVDGMPSAELAGITGLTEGAIRAHLHHGRKALRMALADLR